MKKGMSLQGRLAWMTAGLMTVACLLLTMLLGYSAVSQMNAIEAEMIEVHVADDSSMNMQLYAADLFPELVEQLQSSKELFRVQSFCAAAAVILLGSLLTYLLTRRALEPLRKFSARMETIQAQNLCTPLELPDSGDEISRLARAFNGMLERLDQAFTVQRQFAANAAHELRTPLAVVQTNLEVLKKRGKPTNEEYAEAVEMVQEQTGRLSRLVGVLLELTEVQTAQRTDHVSLDILAEEVIYDLEQLAGDKQIRLLGPKGKGELTGSDLLLYRAVYNLVENAIKYTPPGGEVAVDIRQMKDMVCLTVADTGIGISPENREKIFSPFFRADKSRSRATGGAGLGLALVKDIAQLHGGTVQVEESSAQGTKMALRLPVKGGIGE